MTPQHFGALATKSREQGGLMRASRIVGIGDIEYAEVPLPVRQAGEVLVKVNCFGLCGTDLELLHGTAAYVRDGRRPYPFTYGHEWVGTVAQADELSSLHLNDRVVGHTMITCQHCEACQSGRRNECTNLREVGLYGHQGASAEYLCMPEHSLTRVPDAVEDSSAVLVEPLVTVMAGVNMSRLSPSSNVVVIGSGTVGLLAVQLLRGRVRQLTCAGISPIGLRNARLLGADITVAPADAANIMYDTVIEASGAAEAFQWGLDHLAVGGELIAIGVPHQPLRELDAARLVLHGQSIRGVRHGLDHYVAAIDLLASGRLDISTMLTEPIDAIHASQAFAALARADRPTPKLVLTFQP